MSYLQGMGAGQPPVHAVGVCVGGGVFSVNMQISQLNAGFVNHL